MSKFPDYVIDAGIGDYVASTLSGGGNIPGLALRDRTGAAILDRNGAFILTRV